MKSSYYLIFIMSILTMACSSHEQKENKEQTDQYDSLQYIVAQPSNHLESLLLTGKVITNPNETIVYKPLSEGIVVESFFSVGDYVKSGQKLLTIRSKEFYELQTDIIESQGALKLAQRELNKSQQMFDDGLLSEQNLIEAQIELDKAKSTLERLQATVKMYGISVERGIYQVNAQSDGFIFSKNATLSGVISPGEEVYTLSPINNLLILANVYAKSINEISVGQRVTITSPSYQDSIFYGKIVKLYPYIDSDEKVMKAQIEFKNTNLTLKPDFVVNIQVQNDQLKNRITLPSACLIFDDNKFFTVVKKNGILKRKEVSILSQDKNNTVIKDGIQVGDSILSERQLLYYAQLK